MYDSAEFESQRRLIVWPGRASGSGERVTSAVFTAAPCDSTVWHGKDPPDGRRQHLPDDPGGVAESGVAGAGLCNKLCLALDLDPRTIPTNHSD